MSRCTPKYTDDEVTLEWTLEPILIPYDESAGRVGDTSRTDGKVTRGMASENGCIFDTALVHLSEGGPISVMDTREEKSNETILAFKSPDKADALGRTAMVDVTLP